MALFATYTVMPFLDKLHKTKRLLQALWSSKV